MTDVPFGVLLSGGLDSSLVASITARHLAGTKAAKQWGAQLHSFCVGLEVNFFTFNNKRLWDIEYLNHDLAFSFDALVIINRAEYKLAEIKHI